MWLWSKRTEYFPKLKLTFFIALLAVLDKNPANTGSLMLFFCLQYYYVVLVNRMKNSTVIPQVKMFYS